MIASIASPDCYKCATQGHAKPVALREEQGFAFVLDEFKATKETKIHDIVSKYDLHNTSLEEVVNMVQELRDAGLITFDEGSMLGMFSYAFAERLNGNQNWREVRADYISTTAGELEYHEQFRYRDDVSSKTYLSLKRKLEQLIQFDRGLT